MKGNWNSFPFSLESSAYTSYNMWTIRDRRASDDKKQEQGEQEIRLRGWGIGACPELNKKLASSFQSSYNIWFKSHTVLCFFGTLREKIVELWEKKCYEINAISSEMVIWVALPAMTQRGCIFLFLVLIGTLQSRPSTKWQAPLKWMVSMFFFLCRDNGLL